jgi:hypothetical protein
MNDAPPTNKPHRKLLVAAVIVAVLAIVTVVILLICSPPPPAPDDTTTDQTSQPEKLRIDPDITFPEPADDIDTPTTQVLVGIDGGLTETEHLKIIKKYDNLPLFLVEIDSVGLEELINNQNVDSVSSNKALELYNSLPTLGTTDVVSGYSVNGPDPVSTIGGNIAGAPMPYYSDGVNKFAGSTAGSSGYEVVVIDTGVDKTHSSLTGKVVAEACFNSSTGGSYQGGIKVESNCPGGSLSSTATGSGQDCTINGCGHGTMVAGATAMGRVYLGNDVITAGAATAAKIIAVKIASKQSYITPASTSNPCGTGVSSCTLLNLSDIYSAMDHSITLSQTRDKIVAVNMSLGAGAYNTVSSCRATFTTTYDVFKEAVDTLKEKGIATVVATGNDGDGANQGKIAFPACVDGVVAVGAVSVDGTAVASYSQNGSLTTLLAPGGDYNTSAFGYGLMWLPANGNPDSFSGTQGTSFAAPTVAGAYAVLRSKWPNMSVDNMTQLLTSTGTPITDSRSGYNSLTKPMINLATALSTNLPGFSSSAYAIDGLNIQVDSSSAIQTLINNMSTPYGYVVRNNSNAPVYASGPTPYATWQTLPAATAPVGNGWTIATQSYPLDTYTPQVYTLIVASSPAQGAVIVSVNNGTTMLEIPKGQSRIFTLTTTSTSANSLGYSLAAFNRTSHNDIVIEKCRDLGCASTTLLSNDTANPTAIESIDAAATNKITTTKYRVTVASGFADDAYNIIIGYIFAENK